MPASRLPFLSLSLSLSLSLARSLSLTLFADGHRIAFGRDNNASYRRFASAYSVAIVKVRENAGEKRKIAIASVHASANLDSKRGRLIFNRTAE